MAKPRKAEPAAPDAEEVMYIETGVELEAALSKMFAEAGTSEAEVDVTAHVYFCEPDNTEPKIWKGKPSEYDLDRLAREHGSGKYRLKVYAPDASGQVRLRLNQVFPYKLSAEADARLRAIRKGEVPVAPVNGNGSASLTAADVARIVNEAMNARQAASAIDPLALLQKVTGMVKDLMPPVTAGHGGTDMADVLNMSRSLLTLVNDIRGGDGNNVSEKPGDRAMARGVDLLARMFEQHLSNQPQSTTGTQTRTQAQEGSQVQLTQEQQEQLEDLRMALRFAVRSARSGSDPAEFADSAYDSVPLEAISDMMTNPKWFDVIVANAPEAQQHRDWFMKVREALIGIAVKEGHLTPDGKIVQDQPDGNPDAGAGSAGGAGSSTIGGVTK